MKPARWTVRLASAAFVLCVLTSVSGRAQAVELEYRYLPEWRRFGVVDYVATAGVLGSYLVLELATETPRSASWTSPLPLDRPVRELVVAGTRTQRTRADQVSDVLWYSLVAYSVADAAVAPIVRGWDFDASWQLTMMNLQSYAVASLLVRIPHKFVGRTRPLDEGCRRDPAYSAQCNTPARYVSFMGGHVVISATAAGLVCAHHVFGELYGSVTADAVACMASLAATSVVGVSRVRSDKHWLSDQVPAAAVGLSAGFLLPALVYYRGIPRSTGRRAAPRNSVGTSMSVLPFFSESAVGIRLLLDGA